MLIANHITNPDSWDWGKEVLVTYKKKVLARSDGIQEIYQWQEDVHEEADNRMIIHINHMLKNGISSITVRTLDTDVIVILLSFMVQFINIDEHVSIMVDFGSGDSRRTISINRSFSELGDAVCLGLPFFHTLTGCDSTSAFYKKTKKVFFESWIDYNKHNDLTDAFQHLSWLPTTEMVQSSLKVVEQFVSHLYLKQELDLDKARFLMFSAATNLDLRELPPCKTALKQHILRSAFQAGWIWGNTLSERPPPSKFEWGWNMNADEKSLTINWCPSPPATAVTCKTLTATCKCRGVGSTCNSCTCGRDNMQCLSSCTCKRNCTL